MGLGLVHLSKNFLSVLLAKPAVLAASAGGLRSRGKKNETSGKFLAQVSPGSKEQMRCYPSFEV